MFYVVMEGCSFSEEGVGYVLQNAETIKKFREFAFFWENTAIFLFVGTKKVLELF